MTISEDKNSFKLVDVSSQFVCDIRTLLFRQPARAASFSILFKFGANPLALNEAADLKFSRDAVCRPTATVLSMRLSANAMGFAVRVQRNRVSRLR